MNIHELIKVGGAHVVNYLHQRRSDRVDLCSLRSLTRYPQLARHIRTTSRHDTPAPSRKKRALKPSASESDCPVSFSTPQAVSGSVLAAESSSQEEKDKARKQRAREQLLRLN